MILCQASYRTLWGIPPLDIPRVDDVLKEYISKDISSWKDNDERNESIIRQIQLHERSM
jgi:hypothetical protein